LLKPSQLWKANTQDGVPLLSKLIPTIKNTFLRDIVVSMLAFNEKDRPTYYLLQKQFNTYLQGQAQQQFNTYFQRQAQQ